jgi:asparagine synthetase A
MFVTSQELQDVYPDLDVYGRKNVRPKERSCQQARRHFHYWHGLAKTDRRRKKSAVQVTTGI